MTNQYVVTETRGSKKYCSLCNRQIMREEEYFRLKSVQPLSAQEKIIKLYCLECINIVLEIKKAKVSPSQKTEGVA